MNMEYLFYLLYVVVAAQLFISKPKKEYRLYKRAKLL